MRPKEKRKEVEEKRTEVEERLGTLCCQSGLFRGRLRARQQLQDSLTHTRARVDGNLEPLWGFIGVKRVDR